MGYYKNVATPQRSGGEYKNYSELVAPYLQEWRDMMINIWRDRLDLMGVHDTGSLSRSVAKGTFSVGDDSADITFKYLTYGIYVDLGVGNGYYHGNGGNLEILDDVYRHEHGNTNKKRQRRPWFNVSWRISVEVLKSKLADLMGESFSGLFDNLTNREKG